MIGHTWDSTTGRNFTPAETTWY